MSSVGELACTYACTILADIGSDVTKEKITAITQAAGVTVEPFFPMLFEKHLAGHDLVELLSKQGSAPAPAGGAAEAAPAAGGAAPAGGGDKKAAKKVESESDDDMAMSLFD
eukprot:TRINITY_DN67759_c5_g4_i1.p3 TRINITY_DN67759_c5_g4~~TRINITY_DN67759_c5_g4_i1.p3  ORF type:complete len:112 (+),score=32.73 TRINITY_DN67759_c5_g4_i1:44-379(+)